MNVLCPAPENQLSYKNTLSSSTKTQKSSFQSLFNLVNQFFIFRTFLPNLYPNENRDFPDIQDGNTARCILPERKIFFKKE